MSVAALVFVIAAALYTGFQWTVRVVVYPQFARVPDAGFPAYEREHQRLVSVAVGPLFAVLGVSALTLLARPPAGTSRWWVLGPVLLVGVVLLVTALLAVPLHTRLGRGFDVDVHRRLLRVDTVRLVAAVAATAGGVVVLVR